MKNRFSIVWVATMAITVIAMFIPAQTLWARDWHELHYLRNKGLEEKSPWKTSNIWPI